MAASATSSDPKERVPHTTLVPFLSVGNLTTLENSVGRFWVAIMICKDVAGYLEVTVNRHPCWVCPSSAFMFGVLSFFWLLFLLRNGAWATCQSDKVDFLEL